MSKDTMKLLDKIRLSMDIISANGTFIKKQINSNELESAMHDAYLNTKDAFDLVIQCRALRDMLEEIL